MSGLLRSSRTLPLALTLVTACGGTRVTAPADASFDVAAAASANATLGAMLTGPGMSSVAALGARMPAELGGAGAGPEASRAPDAVSVLALRLLGSLPVPGGPLAVQVIRPAALGHTYVYDAGLHRYVPDPVRPGAPGNGVRFILYAMDPATHEPRAGEESGYADLTDEGAGAALSVGLHFRAVSGGRTFLDYSFTLAPTLTGGAIRVSGFLADDSDRLDFAIGAVAEASAGGQAAQVTFELALPAQRFHASGTVAAAASGSTQVARIDVSMAIGSDAIRFSGEASPAAVRVAVGVNGHLFATITGDPGHPVVRGEGGRELTSAEAQVLGGLVGVLYGIIEMFGHLLEPVAALLGLGTSL